MEINRAPKIEDCDIVSKEEVLEFIYNNYSKAEADVIFAYHKDHPITVDEVGTHKYRWLQTIDYSTELGNDPNQMAMKRGCGEITQEEHMNYNREIGYSLSGYWEIFVFNDNFEDDVYEKDMTALKIKNRENSINEVLK
jgi:hypothetical protein